MKKRRGQSKRGITAQDPNDLPLCALLTVMFRTVNLTGRQSAQIVSSLEVLLLVPNPYTELA